MTTPRPVSVLETPSKIKQPSAEEVNANIKIEWHDVLGPPYPARWEGKMPPTTSESCCCPCCPDEDNDIITRHRLQTRPEYSRGKRTYDEFYGAPIMHGKYSHDFDGRQPKRPAGIRNMVQEQQQQTPQPQQQPQQQQQQQHQQQQMAMMMQQQQQQQRMMMNPQALGGGQQQQQQHPSTMPVVASTANNNNNNNNSMEQEMQPVFSPEKASDGPHPNQSDANSNDRQRQHQETTETATAASRGEPVKRISSEPMVSPNTETRQNAAAAAANQQQQQQPQQQQQEQVIHGFAKYIGIDVENEPHLLPLAQQCLAAPPPPPWQPVRDPNSGRTYYANAQTKQTSWDHPLLPTFRERVVQWRQHYTQQQVQQTSVRKDEGQQEQQQNEQQQEQERPPSNPLSKEGATREVEDEDVTSEDPHRVKDS